jgi:N-acetylneuraminic acid mutarotase
MKSVKIILSMLIAAGGLFYIASPCYAQSPWTQKEDMPTIRAAHASCALDGKIYVLGGGSGTSTGIKTVQVYDPILNSWDSKADMLSGRSRFPACVFDGKILAIGGSQAFKGTPITAIEEYDPVSDSWSHKADMPEARMYPNAAMVDGKIYIMAGCTAAFGPIPEVDVYDPSTGEWTKAAEMLTPRWMSESIALNGKIYVLGGEKSSPWPGLRTVEAYDPATNTWSSKADMITQRKLMAVCVLNGMIYVFGGAMGNTTGVLSSVEAYDPEADTWTEITDMPVSLVQHGGTVLGGKAYLSGGIITPGVWSSSTKTMYEYDPVLDPLEPNAIADKIMQMQRKFSLSQNYPNPFNPGTVIRYALPVTCHLDLSIYNILGQKVATLVSEKQQPGQHQVQWDAAVFPSGIYYYMIKAGEFKQVKKMIFLQ